MYDKNFLYFAVVKVHWVLVLTQNNFILPVPSSVNLLAWILVKKLKPDETDTTCLLYSVFSTVHYNLNKILRKRTIWKVSTLIIPKVTHLVFHHCFLLSKLNNTNSTAITVTFSWIKANSTRNILLSSPSDAWCHLPSTRRTLWASLHNTKLKWKKLQQLHDPFCWLILKFSFI